MLVNFHPRRTSRKFDSDVGQSLKGEPFIRLGFQKRKPSFLRLQYPTAGSTEGRRKGAREWEQLTS